LKIQTHSTAVVFTDQLAKAVPDSYGTCYLKYSAEAFPGSTDMGGAVAQLV